MAQALLVVFNLLLREGADELDDEALLPLLTLCSGLSDTKQLQTMSVAMIQALDTNYSGGACFEDFAAAMRGTQADWATVRLFVSEQRRAADALFGRICRKGDNMNLNLLKQYIKLQNLATEAKEANSCALAMLAGAPALDRDEFAGRFLQAQLDPSSAWHLVVDAAAQVLAH